MYYRLTLLSLELVRIIWTSKCKQLKHMIKHYQNKHFFNVWLPNLSNICGLFFYHSCTTVYWFRSVLEWIFLDSLEFRFFQQKKKVEVAPNYSLPFCCNKLWKEDTENCLWLDARLATRKYLMPDKRHSSYWSPCFHHPSKTESSDYFIHCNITTTQSWKTVTLSYQSGVFSYTKATVVKHSDSNQAKWCMRYPHSCELAELHINRIYAWPSPFLGHWTKLEPKKMQEMRTMTLHE